MTSFAFTPYNILALPGIHHTTNWIVLAQHLAVVLGKPIEMAVELKALTGVVIDDKLEDVGRFNATINLGYPISSGRKDILPIGPELTITGGELIEQVTDKVNITVRIGDEDI